MDQLAISSIDGSGLETRKWKAPGPTLSRNFGTVPPRLTAIDVVGEDAGYDPRIAYLTSVICGWTYSDAAALARQLPYYGLPDCTVSEFRVVNHAMLIIASVYFVRSADGRVGVLAFRGTVPDDFLNWLTDANTTLRNFHYGRVHAGFYGNVEPLWRDIGETLQQAVRGPAAPSESGNGNGHSAPAPLENLYITGHSLGGAMAVLAAARIHANDSEDWQRIVRGVYTFGQPAVGDRNFAEHYSRCFCLYRHIYHRDLVPHMPPRSLDAFVHFGEEFYADEATGWQNVDPPRVKAAANLAISVLVAGFDYLARRVLILRHLKFPYSIEDHGPEGYISASRRSL
jgi:hypothetical protein